MLEDDKQIVLKNFRNKFQGLYNPDTASIPRPSQELQHQMSFVSYNMKCHHQMTPQWSMNEELETAISQLDVIEALYRAKNGKSVGFD